MENHKLCMCNFERKNYLFAVENYHFYATLLVRQIQKSLSKIRINIRYNNNKKK